MCYCSPNLFDTGQTSDCQDVNECDPQTPVPLVDCSGKNFTDEDVSETVPMFATENQPRSHTHVSISTAASHIAELTSLLFCALPFVLVYGHRRNTIKLESGGKTCALLLAVVVIVLFAGPLTLIHQCVLAVRSDLVLRACAGIPKHNLLHSKRPNSAGCSLYVILPMRSSSSCSWSYSDTEPRSPSLACLC
jgi:hypothetical protein